MSYEEYKRLEQDEEDLKRELQTKEARRRMIEKSPDFLKERIRVLEAEVKSLKKELAPHREKERQKAIDDYGSMKCTNKIGCYCPICNGL